MITAHNESESEWFTGDNISIDNISPGVCARLEISPWLSQEMRTWIHSHQTFQQGRSEDQRIREVIPVPDSLWKETTFVRLFAS